MLRLSLFARICVCILAALSACSVSSTQSENAIASQSEARAAQASEEIMSDTSGEWRGWNFLAGRLIADGIAPSSVNAVFQNQALPRFTFVPFRLSPRETNEVYSRMTAPERLARAQLNLDRYREEFEAAEKKYGVSKYAIAAIISIETNWGSFTGNDSVFYRLARIVSTGDANNLQINFRKLKEEDSSVTYNQVQERSRYLFSTFYPHIVALLKIYSGKTDQMLQLKGSSAGAFGLPQFLPKSFQDFAVDGNGDRKIDLFDPVDAIFSVASFLRAHGWKKLLSPQEKLAVLWHYNRSDAYGRAVIRVALSLQNRYLNLDN